MESLNTRKSQLPKILFILAFLTLLTLIPFISPSMRTPYLYFLLNLLIMVLVVETGFLSSSSSNPARDDHKKTLLVVPASQSPITTTTTTTTSTRGSETSMKSKPILMKRCKSRPSLFFIGGTFEEGDYEVKKVEVEVEAEVEVVKVEVEVVIKKREVEEMMMVMSKQELFIKAELLIENFYKQLNIQREKSWNKLHGLYHKD